MSCLHEHPGLLIQPEVAYREGAWTTLSLASEVGLSVSQLSRVIGRVEREGKDKT